MKRNMLRDMEIERLTAPRFRVMRESLGFTQGSFATFVGVTQKSVSAWDTGHSNIPPGIIEVLRKCEEAADDLVAYHVERLKVHPSPTMVTYRNDEQFHEAEPGAIYPAAWHRMVVARIWEAIPELRITYV